MPDPSGVRVRFAPSPTGDFHIGSARTALYNYLFARHEKGTFVLRIEDTDRTRNTPEALEAVYGSLKWLGFGWDEGPYFQSQRIDIYKAAAEKLLTTGRAFHRDDPAKGKCVVFKIDRERVEWNDAIHGPIGRDISQEPDPVILKSDGFPTYNFACVVDDVDMKITHVIRGEDHVSNTPKQISLYRALGATPPVFAHIPLVLYPGGKKMSKRHKMESQSLKVSESKSLGVEGSRTPELLNSRTPKLPDSQTPGLQDFLDLMPSTSVMDYRKKGYLPEALANFIALLGWSPGDNREVMPLDEMIARFTLDRVNARGAQFDVKKLDWLNGEYLRKMPLDTLVEKTRPFLDAAYDMAAVPPEKVREAVRIEQERLKTFGDIVPATKFLFADEIAYDGKAVKKFLTPESLAILGEFGRVLGNLPEFTPDRIHAALEEFAREKSLELKHIAQPLRVAVTGGTVSPPIHETLALLGKETVRARLEKARGAAASGGATC
ncbi:MAG: glutamate--tRNA ligase family protein [Planctomycetota bacterium]